MKTLVVIMFLTTLYILAVTGASAQVYRDHKAELTVKLQEAENIIQKEAFRATVSHIITPDAFVILTVIVECDGAGNVRWKYNKFAGETEEVILVHDRVFRRVGAAEWKDETEIHKSSGTIAVTRWPTFHDDRNFNYFINLFASYFPQTGNVSSPERRKIDGKYLNVFDVLVLGKSENSDDPESTTQFRFYDDGKVGKILSRSRSGITGDIYETTTEFVYGISIEKIESPF